MPGLAGPLGEVDDGAVRDSSASFLVGPLIALGVVGLLVLLLRWAFAGGQSVVARRPRTGVEGDYGLLVTVASPTTYVEGEILRRTLEDAQVRATLTQTLDGPRLLVFPDDLERARALLDRTR
jgi:hypothetical protein